MQQKKRSFAKHKKSVFKPFLIYYFWLREFVALSFGWALLYGALRQKQHLVVVVKKRGQPQHYTEFGAGPGYQADQVAGVYPNLLSPTYIF